MELYQRDSKLLADTFASLTPDTLAAIAAGTAPAPEGIRLAAKKTLFQEFSPVVHTDTDVNDMYVCFLQISQDASPRLTRMASYTPG